MEALSFLNRITINPLVCHGKPTINVNFLDFKLQLNHYIVLKPCEFV